MDLSSSTAAALVLFISPRGEQLKYVLQSLWEVSSVLLTLSLALRLWSVRAAFQFFPMSVLARLTHLPVPVLPPGAALARPRACAPPGSALRC
jgi:hypothetical protein